MAKTMVLKIADIEENPKALRKTVDKESAKYIALRTNIEAFDLQSPISVREFVKDDGSTGYRLVNGLHRKTAMADLGFDEIPVNVVTTTDANLLATQIGANAVDVPTTRSQYAEAIKEMIQLNGATLSEIAAMLKMSVKWVKDTYQLAELPEQVAKLLDAGTIPVQNAAALKRLPAELLEDHLQAAITDKPEVFVRSIDEVMKEYTKAKKTGVKPVIEFVLKPQLRKATELKKWLDEFETTGTVSDLKTLLDSEGVTDPLAAAALALKAVLQIDKLSYNAGKAKFDAERETVRLAKEKREADRKAKKDADATAEVNKAVAA